MKRIRIIFSIALAVVTVFCMTTFSGCGNKSESTAPSTVMFADFEQWAPDFQLMRPMSNFGVVSVNEDRQFVHGGKASAKLQPMGGYRNSTVPYSFDQSQAPYIFFPLSSELFEYDYSDITVLERVTLYLFNAQQEQKNVSVGVVSAVKNIETATLNGGARYELAPGWNRIVYFPDCDLLNLTSDVKEIPGLFLQFDKAFVREAKDAPVYYLDDIEFSVRTAPAPVDELTFDEGEICDFEKRYQAFAVSALCNTEDALGDLSVVRAVDEGISASSGERVLKLVTHPSQTLDDWWSMFVIPEKLVRQSGFMNIPIAERQDYVFRFDVYMKDKVELIYIEYFRAGGLDRVPVKVIDHLTGGDAATGKWLTYEQSFSDFDPYVIENPGHIRMAWPKYTEQVDRTYYFDNFRFEKK